MMDQLKKDTHVGEKRESMSEAAKIARYNVLLLENIYQAYDPERADHVVKVFRKGGVFNVLPIMEEDFEESFDTENDVESHGTEEVDPELLAAGAAGVVGAAAGVVGAAAGIIAGAALIGDDKDKFGDKDGLDDKDKLVGKNSLGDIEEENSYLLDDMDGDKAYGPNDGKNGLYADEQILKNGKRGINAANQSDNTGYDFDHEDPNDLFGKMDDGDDGFNAIACTAIAFGNSNALNDDDELNRNKYSRESSSYYDDGTIGVDLTTRKRKKRRRFKKKKTPYNEKLRKLEQIYDPSAASVKVSFINLASNSTYFIKSNNII
jgi:hypothetical protein